MKLNELQVTDVFILEKEKYKVLSKYRNRMSMTRFSDNKLSEINLDTFNPEIKKL